MKKSIGKPRPTAKNKTIKSVKEKKPVPGRGLNGKTILVTGGAGFIGSNFIRMLLRKYDKIRIINLDKLTYAGNPENMADFKCDLRHEFVHGDIRDASLVTALFEKAQGVFHFAAETHVDRSIVDAGEFVLTDVYGTYILLEALRKSPQVEFFVHISTDEVYGSREKGFFKETDPINPSSPYAASKVGADRMVQAYHTTYGSPVLIVRPSNNYGPYQFPEKFIPLFVTNAMEGKSLPLYGKGLNVRDWLHVEDNCRAIELVGRRGKIGEAYNIGANDERRNIEVAKRIVRLVGASPDLIRFVPDRLGHDTRYAVNISKIKALGWKREVDFEDGIDATVKWYMDNRDWWSRIKEKSAEFKSFYENYYKDRK